MWLLHRLSPLQAAPVQKPSKPIPVRKGRGKRPAPTALETVLEEEEEEVSPKGKFNYWFYANKISGNGKHQSQAVFCFRILIPGGMHGTLRHPLCDSCANQAGQRSLYISTLVDK